MVLGNVETGALRATSQCSTKWAGPGFYSYRLEHPFAKPAGTGPDFSAQMLALSLIWRGRANWAGPLFPPPRANAPVDLCMVAGAASRYRCSSSNIATVCGDRFLQSCGGVIDEAEDRPSATGSPSRFFGLSFQESRLFQRHYHGNQFIADRDAQNIRSLLLPMLCESRVPPLAPHIPMAAPAHCG